MATGLPDILLVGGDENYNPIAQVWLNTGSGFTNMNAGLPGLIAGSSAAVADFNNDGRPDILLSGSLDGTYTHTLLRISGSNTPTGFVELNAGLPSMRDMRRRMRRFRQRRFDRHRDFRF